MLAAGKRSSRVDRSMAGRRTGDRHELKQQECDEGRKRGVRLVRGKERSECASEEKIMDRSEGETNIVRDGKMVEV